jgi:hypothetical protein
LSFHFLRPPIIKGHYNYSDMKKIFVLSALVALAVICACQKQSSSAEQQLAQRKAELDEREIALNQRENELAERESAVTEREKNLAERERAITDARTRPASVQGQTPVSAPVQGDTDPRLQQLPPETRALIPDRSIERVQKLRAKEERERLVPTQPSLGQPQSQMQQPMDKAAIMSGAAAVPASPSPTAQ